LAVVNKASEINSKTRKFDNVKEKKIAKLTLKLEICVSRTGRCISAIAEPADLLTYKKDNF